MRERGGARAVAWLLCAAAAAALCAAAGRRPAGAARRPPLDPSAPLDPMPDIGVDWPDLGDEPADQPTADRGTQAAEPLADAAAELQYSVAIEGLDRVGDAASRRATFDTQSALIEGGARRANAAQVQRRSEADAELLAELLRSRGYYDAEVEPRLEPQGPALSRSRSTPSRASNIASSRSSLPGWKPPGPRRRSFARPLASRPATPVVAEDVIAANINLKVALGEQGFALARVGEQDIVIDHQTRLATLVLPVAPGPLAQFGTIRVGGQAAVRCRARRQHRPFPARRPVRARQGRRFAPGARRDRPGLASPRSRWSPARGNRVDLAVTMQPAPMRTVAGELGYGTGEGFRAEASWQHRNFFTPEGALTVRGVAGTREQLAAVSFRRNNFRGRDHVLNAQLVASNTEFAAYDAKTILLGATSSGRATSSGTRNGPGASAPSCWRPTSAAYSATRRNEETRTFLIAALPASLYYDGSDDLLDPTRGFRLGGRMSPEISARGGSFTYGARRSTAAPTSLFRTARCLPAGFASARSSAPTPRQSRRRGASIPAAAARFAAMATSGLARAIRWRSDRRPRPCRILARSAHPLRQQLRHRPVPRRRHSCPTASRPTSGLAVRGRARPSLLFSSFGPIRIDVGTPLNRREGDGRIAVAVSLGQAF